MTHLTSEQIHKYHRSELSSNEIVSVTNHLRECEVCREQTMKTDQFQKSISSLQVQLADEGHSAYEELSDYVDSKLDPERKSFIEQHSSECEICRLQLEDMRKLQSELKVVHFQPAKSEKRLNKYLLAAILALVALMAVWLIRDLFEKTEPHIVKKPDDSIQLVDGTRRIEISKEGNILNAPGIPEQQVAQMEAIVKSRKLVVSEDLQTLNPKPGTLLGEDPAKNFKLKSPVGIVVLEDRPLFQWNPLSGASAYQVAVLDQDLQPVATSDRIKDQQWQPDQMLERGKVYLWQVTAFTDEGEITSPAPPAPEAMFKIVDEQKFQQIQQAKEANSPSIVLASLYAKSGLVHEAKSELSNLKRENPDSKLIEQLLKSLPE
jgi:hypothetical protein